MRKLVPLAFFLSLFIQCKKSGSPSSTGGNVNPPPPVPPTLKPYVLSWSDEFDHDSIPDTAFWGYDTGGNGWGNNELEYYTSARPENARIENGNLVIEARNELYGGRNYTSARLLTKGKIEWTYGKFDIRAKLPRGRGTWPAIWLLSGHDPLSWPADGELDIMEEVGFNPGYIYGTAHNTKYNGAAGTQAGSFKNIPDAQDSFHIYSLEWSATEVKWSVDSVTYFIYPNSGSGSDSWPYTNNFFLIMNIAIGGNWGGQQGVDDSIFPQQMLVDYVRVYQRK